MVGDKCPETRRWHCAKVPFSETLDELILEDISDVGGGAIDDMVENAVESCWLDLDWS